MAVKQRVKSITFIRVLYPLLLFSAAATVSAQFAEAPRLLEIFRHSVPWWLVLAFLLQILFLLNITGFYHSIYRVVGLHDTKVHLFLLVLATAFTSAVAPGGSISGSGLMLYDARRRGLDTARVVLANVAFYMMDYMAFILVLVMAILILLASGSLQEYQILAAALLLALVGAVLALLVLTCLRPDAVAGFTIHMIRFVGYFSAALRRRIPFWEERINTFITDVAMAARAAGRERIAFLQVALHALLVEVIGLAQLFSLFLAFGYVPALGQLITGYAVGVLFMIVSITPSGVGIMEGAMTVAFVSAGVPVECAALVTFSYRCLSFWLPVAAGLPVIKKVVS